MTVHEIPVPLWRTPLPLEKLAKKGLVTLATRRKIRQAIRQYRIDVLLLYNFPQLILASAAQGECQLVFDVADDLLAMFGAEAGRWDHLLGPVAQWSFNRLAQASDLVTTSSVTLAKRLPGRVRVVPNGVDLDVAEHASGEAIRARYRAPIVGFVGALEYFVDLGLLLEVAALVPEATFLLVGGGRQQAWVQGEVLARQLGNVVLTGPVPYPTNLDYVQAMDICLIPFAPGPIGDHAAPLKLFEYAAQEKPIVSTPLREVQAIAGDFVNTAQDAPETAALIRSILRQPGIFGERARRGLERVRETYNWEQVAGQFVKALAEG